MLKLFEVTSFKNFRHKFSLDFSNVRDYQFNDACVKDGMLKDIIIYGKNSVGKSNFGLALFDIVSHLTSNNVTPGLYENYVNVAALRGEVEFRYVFQFGDDVIEYRYSKSDKKTLIYEHITLNGKLILKKHYSGFPPEMSSDSLEDLSGLKELAPTLNYAFNTDGSLLKYALNNTALAKTHPLYKMMQFVSKMLWFRNLEDQRYIGYTTSTSDFYSLVLDSESNLAEFQELLDSAGVDGKLVVEEEVDGMKKLYTAPTYSPTGRVPFFATASNGTKALYAFFYWYKTAPDISLLFIDEFDAYYHFELSETLVKKLEAMPNTQVILTSHNTNLLTNRIMRPDCYFILTPEKLTSFASATERELREGHNLEKLYIGGEFR